MHNLLKDKKEKCKINNLLKDNKGITLIEVIIVLTIMSVISMILVPNFNNIIKKSKIRSDVQSAKIIKNAMDIYEMEKDEDITNQDNAEAIIKKLSDGGYLNAKETIKPQTKNAKWYYDKKDKLIKIDVGEESIKDYLNENEKIYIKGKGDGGNKGEDNKEKYNEVKDNERKDNLIINCEKIYIINIHNLSKIYEYYKKCF